MADPISLRRPPAGARYDPNAIDAKGATLGDVLTAVTDGSGGKRGDWQAPAVTQAELDALAATVAASAAALAAPDYLVKTATATLSAERVVTDTTTVAVDWSTAGQAKFGVVAGSIGPTELAATTVTPGSYGDATNVPQITVDADGRVTAATEVAITGGGGGGGAPTSPPGSPAVWFKADAGVTINGSNQPTAITNHGSLGGTFTLDATAANRGVIVAAAQNGKDVLQLDGSNESFRFDFSPNVTDIYWMLFIAFRRRGNGSSPRSLASLTRAGVNDTGGNDRAIVYGDDGTPQRFTYFSNSASVTQVTTANDLQYATQILETGRDGDTLRIGFNGLVARTTPANANAAAALNVDTLVIGQAFIGSGGTGSFGLPFDLFEVLFYHGAAAMAESDVELARRYLATRWAIPVASAA